MVCTDSRLQGMWLLLMKMMGKKSGEADLDSILSTEVAQ